MSKTLFSLFLIAVLILAALVSINLFYQAPLQSAISQNSRLRYLQELFVSKKDSKIVYGFLPYWNIKNTTIEPELTHLAFFSLTIAGNGEIITHQDGGLEPGFRHLGSDEFFELAQEVKKMEIVVTQFNNQDIQNFLSSEAAQKRFLTSLDSILLAYPVQGINLDIEYSGSNAANLRPMLSNFVSLVRQHLDEKYRHVNLSIDMYAGAAQDGQIWDVAAIAKNVDYVIVMAYDFHQRSSTQAGPVAPLFGDATRSKNINHYLKNFLDLMPREKILLGIPFYGYGWQTDSRNPRANTYPESGFTVSYKKAKELLAIANGDITNSDSWKGVSAIKKNYDEDALSPFVSYMQDGDTYTIYYEDPSSIAYKLEYARQLDLAGVAIWALGYEDEEGELWEAIRDQ